MNKDKQRIEAKLKIYKFMALVFRVLTVVSFLMLNGFAVMDMITGLYIEEMMFFSFLVL